MFPQDMRDTNVVVVIEDYVTGALFYEQISVSSESFQEVDEMLFLLLLLLLLFTIQHPVHCDQIMRWWSFNINQLLLQT